MLTETFFGIRRAGPWQGTGTALDIRSCRCVKELFNGSHTANYYKIVTDLYLLGHTTLTVPIHMRPLLLPTCRTRSRCASRATMTAPSPTQACTSTPSPTRSGNCGNWHSMNEGRAPCLRLLVVVWIEPNRVGTSMRVQIVLRVNNKRKRQ